MTDRPSAARTRSFRMALAIAVSAAMVGVPTLLADGNLLGATGVATPHLATPLTSHARAAASSVFNPPCYKILTTGQQAVCVSIANVSEPNIIPPAGGKQATVEPNATQNLPLIIKARQPLNWTGSPRNGSNCPVTLNVTGVLWNGDPYMAVADGTTYHGNSASSFYVGPIQVNNLSYPWWYTVTISARSSANAPNFFPGETVSWWIAITQNNSNVYYHNSSAMFTYRLSGAWPYTPYPGAPNSAGNGATFADVNLTAVPRDPNWNDSVRLVLNTTQADVIQRATIGAAYVDVTSTSPNGTVVAAGTIQFNASINGAGFGDVSTFAVIPATYNQVQGSTVTYKIWVFDANQDQIVTPLLGYNVSGNGTFVAGVFTDDLLITTNPGAIAGTAPGSVVVAPGTSVNVTIVSRNPNTAISSAEVNTAWGFPLLGETVPGAIPLHRVSSTIFTGVINGLPLGSFINFTVSAWDFNQRLEVSPTLGYVTNDFASLVPVLPTNTSFFYVLVYDNGTHTWVSGAQVDIQQFIQGQPLGVHTLGNTSFGLAYPNATHSLYTPLLLPANGTFRITVTDPRFLPNGGSFTEPVQVTLLALHQMSARQTLEVNSTFMVVQESNLLLFYLNATLPPAPVSPSTSSSGTVPLAAGLGLAASLGAAIPILLWWRRIRARRQEEEKRITL
ncbi:MAG: hypothetical protein L3K23_10755 [Thermoplasmata archaeon]|nr:hypothetical protein [Thermoplasmata archaeon]